MVAILPSYEAEKSVEIRVCFDVKDLNFGLMSDF